MENKNSKKTYHIPVGADSISAQGQRGITLIALVITIIILLILAGIVINLTIGENGIMKKAIQAGKNYDETGAREKLELALVDLQTQKIIDSTYNETTYIDNYLTKNHMIVDGNIVTVGKWQFEIDRSVPKIASTLGTGDEIITEQKANLIAGNMIDGQVILKIEAALTNDTIQRIEIYDETDTKIKTLSIPTGIKQIQKEQEIYVEFMENKSYYAKIIGQNSDTQTNTVNVKNENVITTAKDLKKLATLVNSGETFEGKTITQVEDIDLSTVCGNGVGNWEPIGYNGQRFNGTYDGNRKEITNLYMNVTEKVAGLFGVLGYKGMIKNIIVYGEIKMTGYNGAVGGIVGRNEGIVDGCINNVTVSGINSTGGITAVNYNIIKNCINKGKITGVEDGTGGIAGRDEKLTENLESDLSTVNPVIENCKNSSDAIIQGTMCIGGICGVQYTSKIDNCINEGTVIATSSIVGGIVGSSDANITNCKNIGTITSNGNPSDQNTTQGTGGIVGRASRSISFSANTGNVTSEGFFSGGIVGFGVSGITIQGCYNYNANIITKQNGAGGIIGKCKGGIISKCYNYFSSNDFCIKAESRVGGIVGVTQQDYVWIGRCYNIGNNIKSNGNANYTGAIIGSINSNVESENVFYLDSSTLPSGGTVDDGTYSDGSVAKSDNDFKKSVEDNTSLTYILNYGIQDNVIWWEQDANINGGYPYLKENRP